MNPYITKTTMLRVHAHVVRHNVVFTDDAPNFMRLVEHAVWMFGSEVHIPECVVVELEDETYWVLDIPSWMESNEDAFEAIPCHDADHGVMLAILT